MDLPIIDFGGGNEGTLSVPDALFNRKYVKSLVHQAVMVSMACSRQGTRAQKNRAEVRHTTKKLFRQKGTGRARGGHSSTPIRRGGGRAFPSSVDENFSRKINRRMFRAAMVAILSKLLSEGRFLAVRSLVSDTYKTADAVKKLSNMSLSGNMVLVDFERDDKDDNLVLACRNIPNVLTLSHSELLPTHLVGADYVVFSERAVTRSAEIWL